MLRIVALLAALGAGACRSAADGGGEAEEPELPPRELGDRSPTSLDHAGVEFPEFAGGETGSFTPSPCGYVSTPVEIDAEEAVALGFPLDELTALVEREVDEPLRWTVKEGPWMVAGYEPDTRVRARMRVAKLAHYRPSEEWCDGTTCQRENAEPVEQATCTQDGLFYYLHTRLVTDDGAIDVAATCLGAIWRNQLEEWASGEEHTGADCYTDIRGELRISGVEGPYLTALSTHFGFDAERTNGSIYATITHVEEPTGEESKLSPRARLSEIPGRRSRPIEGRWLRP